MRILSSLTAAIAFGAALLASAAIAQESTLKEDKPSIWLVLSSGYGNYLHSLPMKSMDQCEEQGAIFLSSKRIERLRNHLGFECLEGK